MGFLAVAAVPETPGWPMNIVVLDGHTLNPGDNPWTGLQSLAPTAIFDRTTEDQRIPRSRGAEILVVNKVRLDRETIGQLPRLKYVTVTATGYDCVDVVAARDRSIPVSNVPVYGTDSVAQFVFAALLHVCCQVKLHDELVRDGEWKRRGDFSFWQTPLTELAGKTMGVVGFGRIGRRVAELAHAFGMHVISHTRNPGSAPGYHPFAWVDLTELVSIADVISLHCPATNETRGMINAQLLRRCRPTAVLINASRGSLVVEQDLADALNRRQLAAAAVDVVSREPISDDNPLLGARNCLITPHMAWATLQARQRLMSSTVENVASFLAGSPQNVVN
jgi:glycerate dehydrogenase